MKSTVVKQKESTKNIKFENHQSESKKYQNRLKYIRISETQSKNRRYPYPSSSMMKYEWGKIDLIREK